MQTGDLILGIDPGLRRTGYAFVLSARGLLPRVVEAGLVRLNPLLPLERRLLELQSGLDELFQAHAVAALACEQLYSHYKHPRTAILMGHARGVILATAARHDVPIFHVSATHAKRALTGAGHARKEQMQRAAAMILGMTQALEPSDVADAIAVAICGAARFAVAPRKPTMTARRR